MFDVIYCKKALPLSKELKALKRDWTKDDFQTKDLENLLYNYEITKTGKLRMCEVEREWVDDENSFLKGHMKEVSSKWVDTTFTGVVRFYTSFSTTEENWHCMSNFTGIDPKKITGDDWWVEFSATIINGRVKKIELLEARSTPATDRIYREMEWSARMNAEEAKLSRRIVRSLRKFSIYRTLIKNARLGADKAHRSIINILFKL